MCMGECLCGGLNMVGPESGTIMRGDNIEVGVDFEVLCSSSTQCGRDSRLCVLKLLAQTPPIHNIQLLSPLFTLLITFCSCDKHHD